MARILPGRDEATRILESGPLRGDAGRPGRDARIGRAKPARTPGAPSSSAAASFLHKRHAPNRRGQRDRPLPDLSQYAGIPGSRSNGGYTALGLPREGEPSGSRKLGLEPAIRFRTNPTSVASSGSSPLAGRASTPSEAAMRRRRPQGGRTYDVAVRGRTVRRRLHVPLRHPVRARKGCGRISTALPEVQLRARGSTWARRASAMCERRRHLLPGQHHRSHRSDHQGHRAHPVAGHRYRPIMGGDHSIWLSHRPRTVAAMRGGEGGDHPQSTATWTLKKKDMRRRLCTPVRGFTPHIPNCPPRRILVQLGRSWRL